MLSLLNIIIGLAWYIRIGQRQHGIEHCVEIKSVTERSFAEGRGVWRKAEWGGKRKYKIYDRIEKKQINS